MLYCIAEDGMGEHMKLVAYHAFTYFYFICFDLILLLSCCLIEF